MGIKKIRRQFAHSFKKMVLIISLMSLSVISSAETLTIGSTATGVPFTFLDTKNNKLDGMMVDVIRLVGERAGFDVSLQQAPFSALIPSLQSKKIDIISAGMIKTEERAKVVSFTEPVYAYGEALFVNNLDMEKPYTTLEDLKGEIVGGQVGTIYIDALNKSGLFKEVRVYDTIPDLIRDVELGRIKAGLADYPIVAYQYSNRSNMRIRIVTEYVPLMTGVVSLVIRQDEPELLARLNTAIAEIKADGSLAAIIDHWNLNMDADE